MIDNVGQQRLRGKRTPIRGTRRQVLAVASDADMIDKEQVGGEKPVASGAQRIADVYVQNQPFS